MLFRRSAACTGVVACLIAASLGQEVSPVPEFKVDASSVVVDVIVTDHKGRHIQGLQASDFALSENGVPQKIVSFSSSEAPQNAKEKPKSPESLNAAAKESAPSPQPQTSRPRLLTVVLDLADNRPENLRKSCETVLKYLDQNLSSSDYVAIYYVDRGLHLGVPFTNDVTQARAVLKQLEQRTGSGQLTGSERASVQKEINELYVQAHPDSQLGMDVESSQFTGGRGNSVPSNPEAVFYEREMGTLRSYLDMQNTYQAKAVFVALRAICQSYLDLPGRKNVVLFSEGFLYSDDAKSEMEAVADAANRANVAFYVIDPVGLDIAGGGVLDRGTSNTVQQMTSIAMEGPGKPGAHSVGESKFDHMRTLGDSSRNGQLEWLADTTGGLMVKNTNDLTPAFSKVVDDARDFYTIVYQPTNKEFDGKFRSIRLELQQKGYQLRYRQGYWAIPHAQAMAMTPAAAQLISAVTKGTLKAAFSASLIADLLLAPNGHYFSPVSISVPGSKLPLQKDGSNFDTGVLLVLTARDKTGRIVSVHQRDWRFQVAGKDRDGFQEKTLTLQTQLALPQLEDLSFQAILQFPDGSAATGDVPLTFAGTHEEGPKLSTVLLSDFAESATCSDNTDPLCVHSIRLHQHASDQFQTSNRLVVYFTADRLELDPKTQKPRVAVNFILKEGNQPVSDTTAQNLQAVPGPTPGSVLIFAEYDLKTLHSGSYRLRAVTKDLVNNIAAFQETRFSIQ